MKFQKLFAQKSIHWCYYLVNYYLYKEEKSDERGQFLWICEEKYFGKQFLKN